MHNDFLEEPYRSNLNASESITISFTKHISSNYPLTNIFQSLKFLLVWLFFKTKNYLITINIKYISATYFNYQILKYNNYIYYNFRFTLIIAKTRDTFYVKYIPINIKPTRWRWCRRSIFFSLTMTNFKSLSL